MSQPEHIYWRRRLTAIAGLAGAVVAAFLGPEIADLYLSTFQ